MAAPPDLSPPPPPAQTETFGLAIAALVCGLAGALLPCPVGLVAIGLGIAALSRINQTPGLGGRGLAIAGIALPCTVGAVVGVGTLIAIAVPNFLRFEARKHQAECRTNLKLLYASELAFFQEHERYSTLNREVYFRPEPRNRYAYFLDTGGQVEDRSGAEPVMTERSSGVGIDTHTWRTKRPVFVVQIPPLAGGLQPGLHGECPKCTFVAACAANLDRDEDLDVWSISTAPRVAPGGEQVPPGIVFHDSDDLAR